MSVVSTHIYRTILFTVMVLGCISLCAQRSPLTLQVFEDSTGNMTAMQVQDAQLASSWKKYPLDWIPNFGVSHSAFWIRYPATVSIQDTSLQYFVIASSVIDSLQVYVERAGVLEATPPQGDRLAFDSRPLATRQFAISWQHRHSSSVQSFLIRTAAFDGLHESVPIRIYSAAEFQRHSNRDQFMYGGYFGTIAFLVVFSLLIFVVMRDRSQFLFAIYAMFFGLWNLIYQGFADELLWPHNPQSNLWIMIATLIFSSSLTLFTIDFLKLRTNIPWLARTLKYLTLVTVCISVPLVWLDHYCGFFLWIMGVFVFSLVLMLVAGVLSIMRGVSEGIFYMASWTLVIGGAILYIGKVLNILPASLLTEMTFQVGTVFQAIVLSIGVALRMLVSQRQLNLSLESLVRKRTNELEVANQHLLKLSSVDSLTGLLNRRKFFENLSMTICLSERNHQPISIVMIDVDFFKQYNDTYGHICGDQCLRLVAKKIEECLPRKTDFCARYGGEEFVICLANTDAQGATLVAQRLRESITDMTLVHEGSSCAKVITVSMGVSSSHNYEGDVQMRLLQCADKALYEAKHLGRNRVYVDGADND